METTIKTYEQKKNSLEQKLELAKELGLKEQVSMIQKELKVSEVEQKSTYEEVTPNKARDLLCPKKVVSFKAQRIGHILPWKRDWVECQHISGSDFGSSLFASLFVRNVCEKIVSHNHTIQFELVREILGTEKNVTPMPMAALILMKEAKAKQVFDSFEVWRPETATEQQKRLEDPWLVGVIGERFFKLCDWR